MGLVYLARDPGLGREVALKLLGRATAESRARFAREVEALGRLRHPAIVSVHAAGEDEGRPYLVLDYVRGQSLAQRLERAGPLTVNEALELLQELAGAVECAHAAGILHRDLKPANVLLDEGGRPQLTDFGLARLRAEASQLSKTGQLSGTPGFWAPEQARGDQGQVGPATDVYGLGATLYACLTGEPPIHGASLAEAVIATQERVPKPPSRLRPDRDARLDALCLRCLAKDPAERFASAGELRQALADVRAGRSGAWAKGPPRRRWWPALVVVLLCGLALGWFLRKRAIQRRLEWCLRLEGFPEHTPERLPANLFEWSLSHGSGQAPSLEDVVAARAHVDEYGYRFMGREQSNELLERFQAAETMLRYRSGEPYDRPLMGGQWPRIANATIAAEEGRAEEAWRWISGAREGDLRQFVAGVVLGRAQGDALARSASCQDLDELRLALERPRSRARRLGIGHRARADWPIHMRARLEDAAPSWRERLGGPELRDPARASDTLQILGAIGEEVRDPGPRFARVLSESRAAFDAWALAKPTERLPRAIEVGNALFAAFPGVAEPSSFERVVEAYTTSLPRVVSVGVAWAMLRAGILPRQGHELLVLAREGGPDRLRQLEPDSRAAAFWEVIRLQRDLRPYDRAEARRVVELCQRARQAPLADLHPALAAFACLYELQASGVARGESLELAREGLRLVDLARFPDLYMSLARRELQELLAQGRESAKCRETMLARIEAFPRLLEQRPELQRENAFTHAWRDCYGPLLVQAHREQDFAAGAALARRYLEIKPQATDDTYYLAWTHLASEARRTQGPAAALELLAPHLRRGPETSHLFAAEAAVALCAVGRRDEARAQLELASERLPMAAAALREIGERLELFARDQ